MRAAGRFVEAVVPARLGSSFRWLLASTVITNAGDGIALAAGPLLVASQTRDPVLVSLALLAEFLPTLLFAVVGGAFADRFDRRRLIVVVNLGRAVVLAVLSVTIATGSVNIAVILGALFVLGAAETFADAASSAMVPRLVARADLGIANARIQGAFLLTNQLVAPSIGAVLFALGMALPFATNAAAFALGALLVWRMVADVPPEARVRRNIGSEMAEGVRWLIDHPAMRTLALTVLTFNVTYGAALGVFVLYASDRLGLGPVGYGVLTSALAVGGIVGSFAYPRLERRFSLADIMRAGLVIETGRHLVLALTTEPVVALVTMVIFGAHELVWGTTATVIRQRAVPDALLGRVSGVYRVASVGGLVLGLPIGGLLARAFGITAPFWFGFVGSALLVAVLWRQFAHIAAPGDDEAD